MALIILSPHWIVNRQRGRIPPPVRQPWFGVACCPGNIARTLASVGQYIFASLETRVRDNPVKLDLHSALMQTGTLRLDIQAEQDQPFTIRLRIPRELDEAATIDGAGHFHILVSIIMPAIKSAMIVKISEFRRGDENRPQRCGFRTAR